MNSNHLNKEVDECESNNKHITENNVYKENNDKYNFSNKLEDENKELKQKISELNNLIKTKEKSNEETIKELKNKCSQLVEERDNLNSIITNMRKEEMNSFEKNDTIAKEIDKLSNDIIKKDEQLKKYAEENENVRRYNEVLRKDLVSIKSETEKKENELAIMSQKHAEIERDKLLLERKVANLEAFIKNLKTEYQNITDNHQILKKQYEDKVNRFEEFNAENYNLKQENADLKRKLSTIQGRIINSERSEPLHRVDQYRSNETSAYIGKNETPYLKKLEVENRDEELKSQDNNEKPIYKIPRGNSASVREDVTNYNSRKIKEIPVKRNTEHKLKGEEFEENNYFPSESYLKRNKKELGSIENRLVELNNQKKIIENEIFKIPDKQKTLVMINKKKQLENELSSIDSEINLLRNRLREINSKK